MGEDLFGKSSLVEGPWNEKADRSNQRKGGVKEPGKKVGEHSPELGQKAKKKEWGIGKLHGWGDSGGTCWGKDKEKT